MFSEAHANGVGSALGAGCATRCRSCAGATPDSERAERLVEGRFSLQAARTKHRLNDLGVIMKVKTASELFYFMTLRIETTESIGTGFFFEHKWKSPDTGAKLTGVFLVTNKHVVDKSAQGIVRFTQRSGDGSSAVLGKFIEVTLTRREWRWWCGHPDPRVDVAILPLNPLFERLKKKGLEPMISIVDEQLLPHNNRFGDLNAIENILFVGYPEGIYDTKNNLPLIRSGITATPPDVDYEDSPTFLIDASVFHGSSGSPIFAYDRGSWLSGTSDWTVGSERVVFLGVLASVLYRTTEGTLELRNIPTAKKAVPLSTEMIDLGVAFKAVTVMEAIEEALRTHGQL